MDLRCIEISSRREQPAPFVVIQKFNRDSRNYCIFVRQFEAQVLGKVENCELFQLLYQRCEQSVQLKISHLSNRAPVIGFEKAWDILY